MEKNKPKMEKFSPSFSPPLVDSLLYIGFGCFGCCLLFSRINKRFRKEGYFYSLFLLRKIWNMKRNTHNLNLWVRGRLYAGHLFATFFMLKTSWCQLLIATTWRQGWLDIKELKFLFLLFYFNFYFFCKQFLPYGTDLW